MARFSTTIPTARSPQATFDYLVDMRNAARWDPGVVDAHVLRSTQSDSTRVEEGTQFLVTLKVAGLPMDVTYEVHDYDRPRRIVLQAKESAFCSIDTVTISPDDDGGSLITYDAVLTTSGVWRFLTPFVALAFDRIGRRAAKGLRHELGR